jgi:hypothetical protein
MLAGKGYDARIPRSRSARNEYQRVPSYVRTTRLAANVTQAEVSLDYKNFEAGDQYVMNRDGEERHVKRLPSH